MKTIVSTSVGASKVPGDYLWPDDTPARSCYVPGGYGGCERSKRGIYRPENRTAARGNLATVKADSHWCHRNASRGWGAPAPPRDRGVRIVAEEQIDSSVADVDRVEVAAAVVGLGARQARRLPIARRLAVALERLRYAVLRAGGEREALRDLRPHGVRPVSGGRERRDQRRHREHDRELGNGKATAGSGSSHVPSRRFASLERRRPLRRGAFNYRQKPVGVKTTDDTQPGRTSS